MRRAFILLLVVWGLGAAARITTYAQQTAPTPVQFTSDGKLVRPADYREWVYVSSGIGMTYASAPPATQAGNFDNVFVNRDSYRQFINTGTWPDRTIFVLEVRSA